MQKSNVIQMINNLKNREFAIIDDAAIIQGIKFIKLLRYDNLLIKDIYDIYIDSQISICIEYPDQEISISNNLLLLDQGSKSFKFDIKDSIPINDIIYHYKEYINN